jgi:putative membrane protein
MSASTATPTPRMRRRTKIAIVVLAILGVILTPLAVNALFAGALSDADSNLSSIPAAVVNNDKMTTTTAADGTERTNFAGRGLVTELTGDGTTGFDWQVTNSDDAEKGLEDGTYYAVLTIPENFSATLDTMGTADPKQGLIDITTDDSHGYLSGIVASTVASAVQAGFGQQITATVVNGIYTSFGGVATSLSDAAGGATQLATGADALASGATQLGDGGAQLTDGLTQYTGGVSSLASGLDQVATQTAPLAQLPAGISSYVGNVDVALQNLNNALAEVQGNPTVSPGAQIALGTAQGYLQQLSSGGQGGSQLLGSTAGLGALPSGIAEVASGADALAANGPALVTGAQGLTDGAQQLASGATQLGDGARTLASGLQSGADQISASSSDSAGGDGATGDTSSAADVIAQPVKVDVTTLNQVTNIGQVVSTILLPTALWIGALAVFLWLRPFSRAVLASSASTARLTTRTFARAGGIAAAQVLLLVGFLHLALGVAWSSFPATLGFSLLVALAFTAFHQFLTTAFGRVGAVVSLVLLALQLAATGGLYPIELLSGPFQAISAISPMTYAVSGIQSILTGGSAGTVLTAALFLAGMLVVSILLALVALARRRRPVEIGWVVPAKPATAPATRARPAAPGQPKLA